MSDVIATTIANKLIDAFKRGNFVYCIGNGGSASMCSHFAAELMGTFGSEIKTLPERKALPVIALTTDLSFITAYVNDSPSGFADIFARQIEALGRENDILIALTTSGHSQNVNVGIQEAKIKKMIVIELPRTGDSTEDIQERQLHLLHEIARLVIKAFI